MVTPPTFIGLISLAVVTPAGLAMALAGDASTALVLTFVFLFGCALPWGGAVAAPVFGPGRALIGALTAVVLLVRRMTTSIEVRRQLTGQDRVTYVVSGPLFFVTSHDLSSRFEIGEDPPHVTLDLSRSRVWDETSVHAVTAVIKAYQLRGTSLTLMSAAPGSLPLT